MPLVTVKDVERELIETVENDQKLPIRLAKENLTSKAHDFFQKLLKGRLAPPKRTIRASGLNCQPRLSAGFAAPVAWLPKACSKICTTAYKG